ncbi:hypothetical protein [Maioricimonas sp. JC845]|uniref:hypothetical protein n=1 Tax=Maioricimonas sp. JC845 TaxID=3232138 RepID=UPI003457C147
MARPDRIHLLGTDQDVSEVQADFTGYYRQGAGPFDLAAVSEDVASQDAPAVVVPVADSPPWRAVWDELPPELASLVPYPEWGALLVFRTDWLKEHAGLSPWDLLVVAAGTGDLAISSGEISDAGEAPLDGELPDLGPRQVVRTPAKVAEALRSASGPGSDPDSRAVRAGLLLLHDRLDESHRVSQAIEGEGRHVSGDYWHGIMHRREPDYGNSKYWFRRVGSHPVFEELGEVSEGILARCEAPDAAAWSDRLGCPDRWDPFAFVDLCQEVSRDPSSPLAAVAREIQWNEMLLLLVQSWRDAT